MLRHFFLILCLGCFAQFALALDTISMVGCEDLNFVHKEKILPRGSALITSSGKLKDQGIVAIIHAGMASRDNRNDEPYNPTIKSLQDSIINSLILAERFQYKRIAVPFMGGGVFFKNLKTDQDELAYIIVKTAYEHANGSELVFLSIDQDQVDSFRVAARRVNSPSISVVKGSITDFKVHRASAIVNSANMEMRFGTGLSGAIAKATGKKKEIDEEAKKMILSL